MRIVRDEDAPPEAFQRDFREDVLEALDPSVAVQRYTRTWRLSVPRLVRDRYLWGKFGFIREDGDTQVVYDDDLQDFLPVEGSGGQGDFSYYVLDLTTQYLVFEQTTDIRPTSFMGAMRKLMWESDDNFYLDAGFVTDIDEFEEWLGTVDHLERVFVSVRQPNPHFKERYEAVQDFVGDSNAARVSIEAVAAKDGESLVTEDTDLGAFIEYAGEEESSVVRATGTANGEKTTFDSKKALRTRDVDVTAADTEQNIIQKFINALNSLMP